MHILTVISWKFSNHFHAFDHLKSNESFSDNISQKNSFSLLFIDRCVNIAYILWCEEVLDLYRVLGKNLHSNERNRNFYKKIDFSS